MYDVKTDTRDMNREHLRGLATTASKIRYLHSLGYSTGEISNILYIRYQHVRNELTRIVKRPKEIEKIAPIAQTIAQNAQAQSASEPNEPVSSVTEQIIWS